MSNLKDSCCIICNKNITDSSTISIRNYMRPLSNPELSLYSFFQLISNFKLLDISEVPQNACDKCYREALHVLDFQTLCNKAVENIKTYAEDIECIKIEHISVGNDCDADILYLPEGDTEDGYDVVEISTNNSGNAKDEDITSLPAPVPAIKKRKQCELSNHSLERRAEQVECGSCHKFYRRDYMIVHKRMHTGKRPLKCKLCPKAFKNSSALKYHMRIHYDERPYKCKVCEKTFRSKGCHDEHYTIHTGEKPFACLECQKEFRLDRMLKQHMVHTHAKIRRNE